MSFLRLTPTWSCSDTRTPHHRVESRQLVHNWSKAKYPLRFQILSLLLCFVKLDQNESLSIVSIEAISTILGKAKLFAISLFLLSRSSWLCNWIMKTRSPRHRVVSQSAVYPWVASQNCSWLVLTCWSKWMPLESVKRWKINDKKGQISVCRSNN